MVAAALLVVVLAATACFPAPGNPNGVATVPAEAQAEDSSNPDVVVGDGTPASCTAAAVVARRRAGRRHHLRLRPGPGHHHADGDGARSSTTPARASSSTAAAR